MRRSNIEYEDRVLDAEEDLNMQTLAPGRTRKPKAIQKLKGTDWTKGEVQMGISIKELKFNNKKVPNAEVITLHRGEKKTLKVPFDKKLDFAFSKVEDEMIFKFAVTSAGDLLGFIYLEIPQKFRSMKEFRLDDWFPVKQIEVDEEEIIKMQNFVARIIIDYKASKKMEIKELFTGQIPREKMYKMLAKNLKGRIDKINEDVNNFQDEGFKHLANFERKLLEKKQEFATKRHKNAFGKTAGKDLLSNQKHTFYGGNVGVTAKKKTLNATSKVAEIFHKETGKDVLLSGGDIEKHQEELLKELTKTKKDLVEKNQRIRALEEGKKNVNNDLLNKKLKEMKGDLLRDKKELAIKLKEQTKALELEREKVQATHQANLLECTEMKAEINDVMGEYQEKYRQLEKLEDEMKNRRNNIDEHEKALNDRMKELDQQEKDMEDERIHLRDLEEELDGLKERMLLERQKIYKEAEKFSYDRGDISTKDKQLALQEEMINSERKRLDEERDRAFKEIERRRKQLDDKAKATGMGSGNFQQMKDDLDNKIKELMDEQKKNKLEEKRLEGVAAEVDQQRVEYEKLKSVADKEKDDNQKTLENDYDFIEQQMKEIDDKRKELDTIQKSLQDYEGMLKEQEASMNLERARFNQDRKKFFDKVEKSGFNPDELQKIAKAHGNDSIMAEKAALLQEKREVEMERKKNTVRASIVGLGKKNNDKDMEERKKKMNTRRSTMVNRLSMTGQNLNALRMEHKFSNIQHIAKFIDNMFEKAVAKNTTKLREGKLNELRNLKTAIEEAEASLLDFQGQLQKAKLDYFLAQPKKKSTVVKKRMSIRPKDPTKRTAQNTMSIEEYKKKHSIIEAKPETTTETNTKTITRVNSQGEEVTETITETVTIVKEEVEENIEEEGGETQEGENQAVEDDNVSMEEFEEEYEEVVEEEPEFNPEELPGNMKELRDNLFKLCDDSIDKLERARPNIEKKNKIDEKTALLGGGKNCVGNIFQVIHYINGAPERLDNAVLKEMEAENTDFDFDGVRLQYEAKIRALIQYIKKIRSNYNFFNQGIDKHLLTGQ